MKKNVKEIAGKGKGFAKEFKEFVMRGNVMDMAIGVIIGGAFADIVTALTKDFINPLINGIGGAEVGGTLKIYGGQEILYGHFISSIVNFLLIAFTLFIIIKVINGVRRAADEAKEKIKARKDEAATEEAE